MNPFLEKYITFKSNTWNKMEILPVLRNSKDLADELAKSDDLEAKKVLVDQNNWVSTLVPIALFTKNLRQT